MGLIEQRNIEQLNQEIRTLKGIIDKYAVRTGFPLIKKTSGSNGAEIKIFEVKANLYDGVYNCCEKELDSTEWTGTGGNDKFADLGETNFTANASTDILTLSAANFANNEQITAKTTGTLPAPLTAGTKYYVINVNGNDLQLSLTSGGAAINITDTGSGTHSLIPNTEVLNLEESDVEATYSPALAKYDLLHAWQIKDDEDNSRWVGIPLVPNPRRAKINQPVPSATSITANLILRDEGEAEDGELGYNITLNGILTTGNLDDAIPRLKDDLDVLATNLAGKWYMAGLVFQAIDETKGLEISSDKLAAKIDTAKGLEFDVNGKMYSTLHVCPEE